MKILYISPTSSGIHSKSLYHDLLKEFSDNGHDVYVAYAREKRFNQVTEAYIKNGVHYLGIKTGNMTKNINFIEKGISTVTIDFLFKKAIKENPDFSDFDIVLYSTPPITFSKTLKYLREENNSALFYLMLKDIFPQNAIDLGLIKKNGILHKYFSHKEKSLLEFSDVVGVMSEENKKYLLDQYPFVSSKVEILPNTITVEELTTSTSRASLELPEEKLILMFGGNLGAPQSIPFVIECLDKIKNEENILLLIIGSGGMDYLIDDYVKNSGNNNVKHYAQLSVEKYSEILTVCDIGLIFLDFNFTIPNFPSRMLSYLSKSKPILCATDSVTDIGKIAERHHFGFQVPSNDAEQWFSKVKEFERNRDLVRLMGQNGLEYLQENCTSDIAYNIIIKHKEDDYVQK